MSRCFINGVLLAYMAISANNGTTKTRRNRAETVKYATNTPLIKQGDKVRSYYVFLLLFLCPK